MNTSKWTRAVGFLSLAVSQSFSCSGADRETADTEMSALALVAAPSGLTASLGPFGDPTLQWTDNSDNEEDFEIQRRAGDGPWEIIDYLAANSVTFLDDNVQVNVTYSYRVRATGATEASEFSNIASVATLDGLRAPTALIAAKSSPTQAELVWQDNSSTEEDFEILRAEASSGPWVAIAGAAANATSFSDTNNIQPGRVYFYRVRATTPIRASEFSNTAGTSDAVLSWNAPVTNADGTPLGDLKGFRVYERSPSDMVSSKDLGNVLTYTREGLPLGTTTFWVTAYDNQMNESAPSMTGTSPVGLTVL